MLSPSSNRLSSTARVGRASRRRIRPEIEYRPDFGVEYLMRQFSRSRSASSGVGQTCAGMIQGSLFENLQLSIVNNGAQHIVADD